MFVLIWPIGQGRAQEVAQSFQTVEQKSDLFTSQPPSRKLDQNSDHGSFFSGSSRGRPGYEVTWYPAQKVRDLNASFGLVRQSLNLGAPIYRQDNNTLIANFGIRHSFFDTDAILPDTKRRFPEQLWNVNFGLMGLHQFDNGWKGGLLLGLGSTSDQPFESSRDLNGTIAGFLNVPAANERDIWSFTVFYMSGGPVNFPLPMISYLWKPSDTFQMNIGLPMSLTWKPYDDWTLNLSYVPLLNINARLTWQVSAQWQWFAAYEYLNETYFLNDRLNSQDRFFALEQRLISGVKQNIGEHFTIELLAGYSFGRRYGEGNSQWRRLNDQVRIKPGPFIGLQAGLRF